MIEGRVQGDSVRQRSTRTAGAAIRRMISGLAIAALLATFVVAGSASAGDGESWYERISFKGDFRARDEVFIREGDKDRHRLRYRLRGGASTEVNDHIEVGFRLATGPDANSGNQSLGSGVNDDESIDFDPDGVFIDKAYLTLKPHGTEKPMFGDSKSITFGKMSNPFKTKGIGPSQLIWDGDQNPEGVALQWGWSPCDCWDTNLDVAYFVIDENNLDPSRDPAMFAVQFDNSVKVNDEISFKSHLTYNALRKLTGDVIGRGEGAGNTEGLTSNNHIDLIEFHGGTTWAAHEDWPVTFWGNVVFNLSADGAGAGKQNTAFGAGLTVGSKKALAEVGAGYFQVEADAVPGFLLDSDLFDGVTNGEGWRIHATRTIFKNTDFNVIAYIGDELDGDVADNLGSAAADRVRIQTNVQVKF
ncbi:MAG: putative porin [Myxococcota bacterium]|jgi:hypothetical protein|nr:putative porin [Myxococcota bacterium]